MQRINKIILFGVLLFATVACQREKAVGGSRMRIAASADALGDTKAEIGDDGFFTWSAEDRIAVHSTTEGYVDFVLESGAGTPSAVFSQEFEGTRNGFAFYPAFVADPDHAASDNLQVILPDSYEIDNTRAEWLDVCASRSRLPMIADNTSDRLRFKYIGGALRIRLDYVPVGTKRMVVTFDKDVAGPFEVDLTNPDAPAINSASLSDKNVITFTLSQALTDVTSNLVLCVPVPVGTYEGLQVECLNDVQSLGQITTDESKSILRAHGKRLLMGNADVPTFDIQVSSEKSIVYKDDGGLVTLSVVFDEGWVGESSFAWTVESGNEYLELVGSTSRTVTLNGLAVGTATLKCTVNGVDSDPITVAVAPDAYTVGGVFSFAAGTTGYFSRGNLQATTADLGTTWTWGFAANQWDYIGANTANTALNGQGSVSTNGTVDLFGWSTDSNYYGINNSTSHSSYSGSFKDWGNALGLDLRTLSRVEWNYVFASRADATYKFGMATVADAHGIIILPDNFTDPYVVNGTATFTPRATTTGYNANIYSAETWKAMELAGAVFLPITGERSGTSLSSTDNGSYWTSTVSSGNYVYNLYTGGTFAGAGTGNYHYRYIGTGVRLVRIR